MAMVNCPLSQTALNSSQQLFIADGSVCVCGNGRVRARGIESWGEKGHGDITFCTFNEKVGQRAADFTHANSNRLVLLPVENTPQSLVDIYAVIRAGGVVVPVDKNLPAERMALLKKSFHHQPLGEHCEQACLGIFTSGSGGEPKLVLHSWQTLIGNACASNAIIPLKPGDRTLLSLPLYHIGGFAQTLRSILSATTLVIGGRVESPEVLNSGGITHTSMVATQLKRVLTSDSRLPLLKSVLIGGGPIEKTLINQALLQGIPVMPTYGMTETASQILTEVEPDKQTLVGDIELKLNAGGVLCVRGTTLFLGYWNAGRLNAARDQHGWFATGDLAQVHENKWIIQGRLDNQFISGGKNVLPEEIERYLKTLPTIAQAFVVPVPHEDFGQVAFAFIKREQELAINDKFEQEIVHKLKAQLPGYLVPRQFAQLPEMPGIKVNRKQLQELAKRMTCK